jgi:hypothetical protein
VFTWIYNGAGGSIWIAILTHAAFNASSALLSSILPRGQTLPGWAQAFGPDWINAVAFGVVALLLLLLTRGRLGWKKPGS